jgi:hypothetical protein
MSVSSQFQRDEKKFSTLNACAQEEYGWGQFVTTYRQVTVQLSTLNERSTLYVYPSRRSNQQNRESQRPHSHSE